MKIGAYLAMSAISAAYAANLPVREVVLFKHGVGYFERSGSIPAGETAKLEFNAAEMNDVLKSLILNGRNQSIKGLRYDSSVPLDQKLANFPFKIDPAATLSAVIDQLKGSRLQMQIGGEKIEGDVVAARVISGDKERGERQQVVLLMDSGEMRSFDFDAASSLRFASPEIQRQFKDYLAALTASRARDKRALYIDGNSTGTRDVTASYIISMPTWKSSYRLVFPQSGDAILEGWAIVDNTTDEDWTNVQLALVSGKPISFIADLYAPKFIGREVASLPEEKAQAPVLHEAAVDAVAASGGAIASGTRAGGGGGFGPGHGGGFGGGAYKISGTSVITRATEIADLFEYRIQGPVTVRRNESAMLPFLQDKIRARKLLIYTSANEKHPLNAVELTNSTAKTLDGGPITVYDAGSYAGEALVETVKSNDRRLISYGVDLGILISKDLQGRDGSVIELHASGGVLKLQRSTTRDTNYRLRNVDAKQKTVWIEHPMEAGFHVVNQKPVESTSTAYRFEVALPPGASEVFKVSEERIDEQSIMIRDVEQEAVLAYSRTARLSAAARLGLERLASARRELAENIEQQKVADGLVSNLSQDEERMRKNLSSLTGIAGQRELVQKYAAELERMETELSAERGRQRALVGKQAKLQGELERSITTMEF
jgi:hypothetical protein